MAKRCHEILIFCIILSIIVLMRARRISKGSCGSNAVFYRVAKDYILTVNPIARNITDDLMGCVDICIEVPACIAINTHKRQDSKIDCHSLKDDHISKPNVVKAKTGWNLYFTGTTDISRTVGSKCLMMTQNPCPSHCTCVDTCDGHRCDCYGSEIYKSCRDALTQNPGSQRLFWIMPEGISAAVYAQCFKQSDLTYMMSITHDGEAETYVKGPESHYSYHKSFSYPMNSLSDMAAVVDVLGSCKQFTRIKCKDMLYAGHGGLVDRNGKLYSGYLGGGSSEGIGCACGVTSSCDTRSKLCNCDSNTDTILEDEGYVTNSSILPVTGIKLGDTGDSGEYAYHTVGSLQCFDTFKTCTEALNDAPDGGPNYYIKAVGSSSAVYTNCT